MKTTLPFYLKLACVLIILICLGYLAIIGKTILAPLLFALLFALLLLPLSNFFENKLKFPRSLGAGVSLIIFLLGVSIIIYSLSSQIANLTKEWPSLKEQLGNLFQNLQTWFETTFNVNIHKQTEYIDKTTSKVLSSSGSIIEQTVISASTLLLLTIFTLIYTFFILLYRRHLMNFIVAAFTEKHRSVIYDISEEIKSIVRKYITGLFFQMAILVALSSLVFWIIGIKYVFLLALLLGVLNLIPYLGIYTALFIGICITFANSDPHHVLYLAIAVIGIHLVDSNFLMPKIVGSQIRINPLVIILGVVIGEMMWGIPGMFLSVSYLAIAKIIFDRVEGLKPWGILLGDEAQPKTNLKLKIGKSKKQSNKKKSE
jgi:putative permease